MSTRAKIDLPALQRAVPDQISLPGTAEFERATSIWNGAIKRRPAAVAHCRNAEDVSRAIRHAAEHSIEVSVRGGGHNFAGNALCDSGLTLDLSPMHQVSVDRERLLARCGGGATWAQLDGACQAHGLAVTGGMISHTGVGGLALGGGLGWLHARMGLTCDNLVSAEVVTADGRILRASEIEHPELFWGLRGGGGNFGVVTEFEFRLTRVGPLIQLGMFFYLAERSAEMLRFANDFTREISRDTGVFIGGMSAPPAPFVPAEFQGQPCFALLVAGLGDPAAHAKQVEAIRRAARPDFELVTPMPYTELQKMFDASAAWGTLGYEKAVYLRDLSHAAIDVLVKHVPLRAAPTSFIPILVLGGAYADVPEESVAFGGKRDIRFVVNFTALAPTPELFEADTAWVRNAWADLVSYADDVGSYVNYIVEADQARVVAAYGERKYGRLAAIKAEYDPDNMFRLNANIRPARGSLI
jgi:FAD/FMN-containing dehydrogenase